MNNYQSSELVDVTIKKGVHKAHQNLKTLFILGLLAGIFIGLSCIAFIKLCTLIPGGFGYFLGALMFPLGLVFIILLGGELATGDMAVLSFALIAKKIKFHEWFRTIIIVTVANALGALFCAYVFGYQTNLLSDCYDSVVHIAHGKLNGSLLAAFFSGIACNILVSGGVYLSYASNEFSGKILAIYASVSTFVVCGFQHVVANMFYLPAAIFLGQATWYDYPLNILVVFLGNLVGGMIFIAFAYYVCYNVFEKHDSI